MKRWLSMLLVCAVTFVVGCGSSASTPPIGTVGEGDYQEITMRIRDVGELDDEDVPYAVIEMRNGMNRSVSLDFDGPSHYETTLGDKRSSSLQVDGGSYDIRAKAPSLKTRDMSYFFESGHRYHMEITTARARVD